MNDNLDIKEWIRYAQMDYDTARKIAEQFRPIPLEIVCYHCQQAAEKILKAYAIANGEPLIKTHDLIIILNQCEKHDDSFIVHSKSCLLLRGYAVIHKYPSKEDSISEYDMQIALKNTKTVFEFTKSKLAELGYVM
jgi:HEPN domain-containing protein